VNISSSVNSIPTFKSQLKNPDITNDVKESTSDIFKNNINDKVVNEEVEVCTIL